MMHRAHVVTSQQIEGSYAIGLNCNICGPVGIANTDDSARKAALEHVDRAKRKVKP